MSTQPADVPRDPSEYRLSIHAQQRRRERDIACPEIAQAIRGGEVRNTDKANLRHFVCDLPEAEPPVYVAADITSGEIVTVGWKDQ